LWSNTGLAGVVFRKLYPDSLLREFVSIAVPLRSREIEVGVHEVIVLVAGGPPRAVRFQYPFRENATLCMVFVDEFEVVGGDQCRVERLAS
jgi:hypothetical protein